MCLGTPKKMIMKKVLLTIVSCCCLLGIVFSQTVEIPYRAFQFGFVPFMSTNGLLAKDYTNSASFYLLAGVSKNEKAFTFGGLSNVILNDAGGFQFAGLSNYIGNTGKGFQFAGLGNINKNGFNGFQFAGLINMAGEIKGFQFAGLSNVVGDVDGFQFAGLINKAKNVNGIQFAGLVNIAENSDCPIGLVNIIKNGEKGIALTYDVLGSTVVSFRSGGKYTYGIIGIGYNHKTNGNSVTTEAGLGAHIPCLSWFRIHNEIKVSSIGNFSDKPVFNGGYSLLPAFKIGKHYEVFGGASINYMTTDNIENCEIFPKHSLWKKNSSVRLQQVYVGYQVGVHFLF